MKKQVFTIVTLAAFMFTACKKDKDETFQINKDTLAGTYTFGTVMAKYGTAPEQDITSSTYSTCEKDDKVVLNTNMTSTYVDAGVKCNPPGDDTGTWAVTSNNTKLSMDGYEMTIASFDGKTLKLTETTTYNGTSVTITTSLNKQ